MQIPFDGSLVPPLKCILAKCVYQGNPYGIAGYAPLDCVLLVYWFVDDSFWSALGGF